MPAVDAKPTKKAPDKRDQPGESLRDRKKRLTRRRIRDAASQLFIEQTFANTTIDAIAELADISKPTFFNYYPTKLAVLQDLIDITDSQFVRYITEEIMHPASTGERLQHLMLRSAHYIKNAPEITRLTLVEGLGALGDQNMASTRFSRLHRAMAALITAGIEQKDVRSDYSVELMVRILVGGYLYTLLNWLPGQDYDLEQSMAETATFLAESLTPPQPCLHMPDRPTNEG